MRMGAGERFAWIRRVSLSEGKPVHGNHAGVGCHEGPGYAGNVRGVTCSTGSCCIRQISGKGDQSGMGFFAQTGPCISGMA